LTLKGIVFVTGGVCSSLGKGITCASLAMLLEKQNIRVGIVKLDPYLNVDPGTMNPLQHGEVYVTQDGAEVDMDLGHYHRFSSVPILRSSSVSAGQVYHSVLKKERRGDFLGNTVQVIPHITGEIRERIFQAAEESKAEILFVEVGGTVGDIESLPFLEAIRQVEQQRSVPCINIHLTYVPYLEAAKEWKSKPTQHSVQALRSIGLFPDILLCRCERDLPEELRHKISRFCSVPSDRVFAEPDAKNFVYEVPLQLHSQGMDDALCRFLHLPMEQQVDLSDWRDLLKRFQTLQKIEEGAHKVSIGVVGKYLQHRDAYASVFESLNHASLALEVPIDIRYVEADALEPQTDQEDQDGAWNVLRGCDGVLVPGGFGERGWNGKILALQWCREYKVPCFGICLGMQAMVVEFGRHGMGWNDADSTECNAETTHPLISLLSEQDQIEHVGGTMRLGDFVCQVQKGTRLYEAYGESEACERHRHRYEFNAEYRSALERGHAGESLIFSGVHGTGKDVLVEAVEVKDHPWMVGVQFHPEFKSKALSPAPLFKEFVRKVREHKGQKVGS